MVRLAYWSYVSVPEARTYDVRVRLKRLNNRGIWQLAVGGSNLGPTVDGFATAASFPEVDLGNTTFTSAGNKTFRFTVTGNDSLVTSMAGDRRRNSSHSTVPEPA